MRSPISWASIAARRERNHSKDSKSRQIYHTLVYNKRTRKVGKSVEEDSCGGRDRGGGTQKK
jgi:hypothetical protein